MTRATEAAGIFVTGTDTEVGKTLVSTALVDLMIARGLRTAAMKPVAAGCEDIDGEWRNADALALMARANVGADYRTVNPYALRPPIAPHIAAAQAGIRIETAVLDAAFERLGRMADFVVVEGAGGFLVPLGEHLDFADLAARWRLPVLLVVGLRLGCLNHALLSVEAINARGLRLAGWIGSGVDPAFASAADNIATLRARIAAPCLGIVPHLGAPDPTTCARHLALGEHLPGAGDAGK